MIPHIDKSTIFESLQAAIDAVYGCEECLAHAWHKGQSKQKYNGGPLKKITLCCNHCERPWPTHSLSIDPSDHRKGKSIQIDCPAHVNLSCAGGPWHITKAVWQHNHDQEIPPGGKAPRPPTQTQHNVVARFSSANVRGMSAVE